MVVVVVVVVAVAVAAAAAAAAAAHYYHYYGCYDQRAVANSLISFPAAVITHPFRR
jgi:hypothetical protein